MDITNTPIFAIDTEVAPVDDNPQIFALQPWRIKKGQIKCTFASTWNPKHTVSLSHPQLKEKGNGLFPAKDGLYLAHNWMYDATVLENYLPSNFLHQYTLWDTMLLSKHYNFNTPSHSLKNLAKLYLYNWPEINKFIEMKEYEIEHDFQTQFTQEYNLLDCQATYLLFFILWNHLNQSQKIAFIYEQESLSMSAHSIHVGHYIDLKYINELLDKYMTRMTELESILLLDSKTLGSNDKLGDYLFKQLQLPINFYTATGKPSINKDSLVDAYSAHPHVKLIHEWRKLRTRVSKYVKKVPATCEYLGEPIFRPQPKVFGTYTGRFTYSSIISTKVTKITKKGKKSKVNKEYHVSDAVHQRAKGEVRKIYKPPPGMKIVEFDADGQEMRWMAQLSQDPVLIDVFRNGKDIHAILGADNIHISYDEFMHRKKLGDEKIIGKAGARQSGKIGNLAGMYRISAPALQKRALTDYGLDMSLTDAKNLLKTLKTTYKNLPLYYKQTIKRAQDKGYAETLAGRRCYLNFNGSDDWQAEQTAINFPIQGTGSEQKYLALSILKTEAPEFHFWMDMHDGLWFVVNEYIPDSRIKEINDILNNINYKQHWGIDILLPMTWSAQVGPSMGELQEL